MPPAAQSASRPLATATLNALRIGTDGAAPTRVVVRGYARPGGGGAGADQNAPAPAPAPAPVPEEQQVNPPPPPAGDEPPPAPPAVQIADEPRALQVPFAPHTTGIFWPIRGTRNRNGRLVSFQKAGGGIHGNGARRMLADRNNGTMYHSGIDLFGDHHDMVVACEDGEIVAFYHFYRSTYALIVQNDSGSVINYGEVADNSLRRFGLRRGSRVRAGQPIAEVGRMHSSSMLHFEMYVRGTRGNKRYQKSDARPPAATLDPTKYLIHLAQNGR